MTRTIAGVLTLALGLMAGTAQAQAQTHSASSSTTPITFGGSLGLSMPMGDAGDGLNTGLNLEGLVGIQPQTMPVEFRGELMYHHFGVSGGGGHESLLGIVPNVLYAFKTQSHLRPYVIGGLGLYHVSVSFTGVAPGGGTFTVSDGETHVGINFGGGVRFPLSNSRASMFVEARFHDVFADNSFNMIPITVGITF